MINNLQEYREMKNDLMRFGINMSTPQNRQVIINTIDRDLNEDELSVIDSLLIRCGVLSRDIYYIKTNNYFDIDTTKEKDTFNLSTIDGIYELEELGFICHVINELEKEYDKVVDKEINQMLDTLENEDLRENLRKFILEIGLVNFLREGYLISKS